MRNLNTIASIIAFSVGAPIAVTIALSLVFSPFQTAARASEPKPAFEVSDLAQPEAPNLIQVTLSESDDTESGSGESFNMDGETVAYGSVDASFDTLPSASCTFDWNGEANPTAQNSEYATGFYTSDQLYQNGVIYDGDYRYTWYSQRVLPGAGLAIEGRHVSDEGYVVDAQERIVVASSDLDWGTEVSVPFGSGTAVVLDSGCDSGTLDIYTDF